MSTCLHPHLLPSLTERTLYPFAVGVWTPGQPAPTFSHFDHINAAALFATIMEVTGNEVRYYVANLDHQILYSSRLGWIETGTFDPALSHEVRTVCLRKVGALQ